MMALTAGAFLPVQAALNARMGKAVDNPIIAAFISFAVGTLTLSIYLLITRPSFSLPAAVKNAPSLAWIAGLLGTFYVAASILLLPRLGVALMFSLVVFGQMLITLVIDHYGLLGVAVKTINFYRVAGVALIIAGVMLIRKF